MWTSLASLEADELSDSGGIPPENVVIASHHDRNAHQTEGLQLSERRRVISISLTSNSTPRRESMVFVMAQLLQPGDG